MRLNEEKVDYSLASDYSTSYSPVSIQCVVSSIGVHVEWIEFLLATPF